MYSIIRKQSHKKTSIQAVHNHNMRKVIEENVNSKKSHLNEILIGTENTRSDIMDYIKTNDIVVRNKDTVVFNEFVLTASPEFFFNNKDGSKKTRSEYESNLKDWVKTQVEFLEKENYGKCVNAVLHLDESTPHIHALILPIVDNKLNNKSFWRGKNSYGRLQDIYNSANSKFGLKRGEEKSKTLVNHTTLKDYRDLIRQDLDEEKQFFNELSKTILDVPPRKNVIGIEKKYSADEVKDLAATAFKKLNRQRRRAKFRTKEAEKKADAAASEFYKKRNEVSKVEYFANEKKEQLQKISAENSSLKTKNLELMKTQSDLELVKKFLPAELQQLLVRARELASGGGSDETKLTTPSPAADLTTYTRPKYK
ncbi:plasmid recombination enzyme family protein [Shigella flexneri]|nr:plasmid recombination enzyme family protein [Shigella flexneri]